MSQYLHSSLITLSTADLNKAFDEGFDFTSTQALRVYWKAYAASSHFDDDFVQLRSRNLFWRLLNSPEKAQSITSLQLVQLWQRCQNVQPLEPLQLHERFTRVLTSESTSIGGDSLRLEPHDDDDDAGDDVHDDDDDNDNRGPRDSTDRPRPAETSESNDRGILSAPTEFTQRRRSDDRVRRTSAPGGTNAATASRSGVRRSQNSKGRAPTTTTTGRGKARPTVSRRRSSQCKGQSQANATKPKSRSALKSPETKALSAADHEILQARGTPRNIPVRATQATFTLPSASSWQSIDEKAESVSAMMDASPGARGSLVDRDFRRTFAESQRSAPSSSNLATTDRGRRTGSIVRFDDDPELIGQGRDKGRTSSPGRHSSESLRRHQRSNSDAISDGNGDDDDEEADALTTTMPRVESNLSKLIRNGQKQSSGQQELSTSRRGQMPIVSDNSSSRRKEKEILEMGRKAGAPVIPKARPGSEAPGQFQLPSPGATF